MAESLFTVETTGATCFGSSDEQGILLLETKKVADKPSILGLYAVSDTPERTAYYLWVDSNGKLRIHTSIPTNQDSDGTIVGTQSA
jgi:hypothetical protein